MKHKLIIRSDGGGAIGLGHLNRCLALAEILSEDFKSCFVCKVLPAETENEIRKEGHNLVKISDESEFLKSLSSKDIVLLDGYTFTSDLQKEIKSVGCTLVCIDDIQDRHYFADLIINYSPNINNDKFSKEPYTKICTGTDYILLRQPFINNPPLSDSNRRGILLCVGGSDPLDLSFRFCNVMSKLNIESNVILGNSYNGALLNNPFKNVTVLKNLNAEQMAEQMKKAETGIFSSSTTAFESIAMRLPFLTFYYIDNQKLFFNYLIDSKLAVDVSIDELRPDYLKNKIDHIQSRKKEIIEKYSGFIDFKSPQRIRNTFKNLLYEKRH